MMPARLAQRQTGPWQRELDAFVRAFAGAFLFGVPSLYTLETWELGSQLEPRPLLAFVALALVAGLGLAYFAGFKLEQPSLAASVEQSVEALAVSVVSALAVLLALNRITPADPLSEIVGKLTVQVVPLAMGVAVANALFSPGRTHGWERGEQERRRRAPVGVWRATVGDLAATVAGGALIGFSIAPTEEIQRLAGGLTLGHQLGLVGLSLACTHAIVFASGFDPERRLPRPRGIFRHPTSETVAAYLVSLLVAFGALCLFGRLSPETPLAFALAQVLVLGLPTAIGGAAGRLVA